MDSNSKYSSVGLVLLDTACVRFPQAVRQRSLVTLPAGATPLGHITTPRILLLTGIWVVLLIKIVL